MVQKLKAFLIVCIIASSSALAQEEGGTFKDVLLAIEQSDWENTDRIVTRLGQPAVQTLVAWSRLRAGGATWQEYHDFLSQNQQWPGLKRLRKQAEYALNDVTPKREIQNFFADQSPQTGAGALHLIGTDADKAVTAWTELTLTKNEQSTFLKRFPTQLSSHHHDRLDNLLWRGALTQAQAMIPMVSSEMASLAQARIALQRGSETVDVILADLPDTLKNDAGIAYDRFQVRIKKGLWDEAQELLVSITGSPDKMGRPEKWASRRRGFARRAMRAGDTKTAYDLAHQHGLPSGSNYADLEWLSGYIALHYMKAPKQALIHFQNFDAAVKSPISRGRAGYWLGQTYEAIKKYDRAAASYRDAAKYQTSFYGQLATQRNRGKPDTTLAGTEPVGDWRKADFVNDTVFQAAALFHAAGEPIKTRWFLAHMAETLPRDQLILLAEYTRQVGADFASLSIAKEAVKRGIILPAAYFPLTDLATFTQAVPAEVAMSIARRESELNPAASSPAGARGLMQVMPATARGVAAKLEVEYDAQKLSKDWQYNATLGTTYLGGLIEKYEGSYILAFAAYNAGPSRVDEWIETYGDPRKTDTNAVHWIENIPYRETRNYVMRVIESLHVYRARIAGKTLPLSIFQDLSR